MRLVPLRGLPRVVLAIALGLLGAACSDAGQDPAGDAGDDRTSVVTPDASSPKPDAGRRLLPHDGVVLPNMQVGIVYLEDADGGSPPPQDANLGWILGSPYWLTLDEYGIGNGAVVGNARVAMSQFFQSGDVDGNGLVDVIVLQARLRSALHPASDASPPMIDLPGAQAYVVYLPDGLNVALGHSGSYTFQTCIDSSGYHAYDGLEPYAVLPPCSDGRTLYAASHELAEMATDPQPYDGWVSDQDLSSNGGEVADLCNTETFAFGVWLAQLWSNQSAACVP